MMKKKFIIVDTGEEVFLGDVITITTSKEEDYCVYEETRTFTITEKNIPTLIKEGIIAEKSPKVNKKAIPNTVEGYIQSLADRYGWTYDKMDSYLAKLDDLYPAAAFSLLLKAIAKRLDKKYEGHISEASEIWVVSMVNGKVCKADKKDIINYDNFAAFRTKEDALFATTVLKPCIIRLFGYAKQKDC